MSNKEILDMMVSKILKSMDYYLNDRGMTITDAILETKKNTCAGKKAWETALVAHFSK